MAVNLDSLFQNANISSSEKVIRDAVISAATNDTAGVKQAVEQLKNLMLGDIFSGEILSLDGGKATISLSGGGVINASLLENTAISKGENVMFMVESNSEKQISLKVLDTSSREMVMISKALSAAGMSVNGSSISMVKALLNNSMPIDKHTLSEISRQMMNFPDASADTIVRLNKLSIPVTENNITQFEAYRSYEHQMSGMLDNAAADFSELMREYASEGRFSEGLKLFSEAVSVMGENNHVIDKALASNLAKIISGAGSSEEFMKLAEGLDSIQSDTSHSEAPQINKQFTMQDFLGELGRIAANPAADKTTLASLFKSDDFNALFGNLLDTKLRISPEEVADKKEVKAFYSRILEKVRMLNDLMSRSGNESSPLAKTLTAVKDNLNFMNDLSHNMTFMQFPIKFSEGKAQGDLYVYTNKKSLREHPDNISALLHLDMEHLGPMDIYVSLNGKNVSTNFCLASEEMLDFVYEHIDELNSRIDKLGFSFKFTMNIKEDKEDASGSNTKQVDFVKDFLDKNTPLIGVKSYLFDSKV